MTQQTGQPQTTALANAPKTRVATFKDLLTRAAPSISAVLPKHLTAERMLKVATIAVTRDPKLLECEPSTIVQSIVLCSQLGLEPGSTFGHAYLLPFWNSKNNRHECQFIPGYRGLIELMARSGELSGPPIVALVWELDEFSFEVTEDGYKLSHKPNLDSPREVYRYVYGIAKLKNGEKVIEVMKRSQVLHIRDKAQLLMKRKTQEGPWFTDEPEMARKTLVKRIAKYLPLSIELASAIELDNRNESGEYDISGLGFEEAEVIGEPETPPTPTKGVGGLKAAATGETAKPAAKTAAPSAEPKKAPEPAAAPPQTSAPAEPAQQAASESEPPQTASGGFTPAPVAEEDVNRRGIIERVQTILAQMSEGKKNGPSYRNALVSSWSDGWLETQEALFTDAATAPLLAQILERAEEAIAPND